MRYIPIHDLELPEGWQEKAGRLSEDLRNASDDRERAEIMEKNPIWRELFVPMSRLSHGKCWYSEARDVMSDRDIDHFRPKNEAKNYDGIPRASTEGYWWLAYDYENYRFSSTYSNQRRRDKFVDEHKVGGKWCYFPLFEGSIVAATKRSRRDEDIMLLDPCDKDDPVLLTFDSTGVPIPNAGAVLNDKEKLRVKTSVTLYHLDHEPLREEREKVWDLCQRLINEMRNLAIQDDLGITDRATIKNLRDRIREMGKKEAELSAVAMACCEHNGLASLTEAR